MCLTAEHVYLCDRAELEKKKIACHHYEKPVVAFDQTLSSVMKCFFASYGSSCSVTDYKQSKMIKDRKILFKAKTPAWSLIKP